ncbi:MAG TPA: sigma-70 family RNA polymerase sigma factor [Polyangiaceae bacterium]|nr:sigma-70 family RNA polymerase sigma factor [Polyangiaceae bacterium]
MMLGALLMMPPVAKPSVDAFSREAAELSPLLRAVAASVLGVAPSHPDVDDAVGETMRRAIEGRERLRKGEPLRGWMVGIARHVALDAARTRTRALKRQAPPPASESSPDVADRVPDSKPSPFDRAARAEDAAELTRALDALPEKQREALLCFFVEGMSYVEIAGRLNVPMGTVATWILRGRRALAVTLEHRRNA